VVSNGRHGTVVADEGRLDPSMSQQRLRASAIDLAVAARQAGATPEEAHRWLDEAIGQYRLAGG
jgi:hypothetical protein